MHAGCCIRAERREPGHADSLLTQCAASSRGGLSELLDEGDALAVKLGMKPLSVRLAALKARQDALPPGANKAELGVPVRSADRDPGAGDLPRRELEERARRVGPMQVVEDEDEPVGRSGAAGYQGPDGADDIA